MSENNTEKFYFKMESTKEEMYLPGQFDAFGYPMSITFKTDELYISYTHNEQQCYIGGGNEWESIERKVSYSELIEFSKAVNNVIKMMEENMKEE